MFLNNKSEEVGVDLGGVREDCGMSMIKIYYMHYEILNE